MESYRMLQEGSGMCGENQKQLTAVAGSSSSSSWRRRRRLILLLNDLPRGFSIRHIDLDAGDHASIAIDGALQAPHRLPGPPALRLEPGGDHYCTVLAAMGPKLVMVTKPKHAQAQDPSPPPNPMLLLYDVPTAVLSMGPPAPAHLVDTYRGVKNTHAAVAVGETLYVLTCAQGALPHHAFMALSRDATTGGWSWTTVPSPPPFGPHLEVAAWARHPDSRTIFFTVMDGFTAVKKSTFSFDTQRCVWRWHGLWVLPFKGEGHFDADLDSWVGLSRHNYGDISSCKVVSPSFVSPSKDIFGGYKEVKLVKPKALRRESYTPATLARIGANRFCLVESVPCEGVDSESGMFGMPDAYVLLLTVFSLSHGQGRELQATIHQPTRSYHRTQCFSFSFHSNFPLAFWM